MPLSSLPMLFNFSSCRHNDLPFAIRDRFQNHLDEFNLISTTDFGWDTDITRLREGKVGAQVEKQTYQQWSPYVKTEKCCMPYNFIACNTSRLELPTTLQPVTIMCTEQLEFISKLISLQSSSSGLLIWAAILNTMMRRELFWIKWT